MILFAPATAGAQSAAELDAVRQELSRLREELERIHQEADARVAALEAKLSELKAPDVSTSPAEATPAPTALTVAVTPLDSTPPSASVQVGTGEAAASKIFNPDVAVIGDFVGAAGRNHVNPAPALQLQESEASFQAAVDPYARADFFLAFGQEGVDVEEGFVTFPTIPGGVMLKAGKMRAAFGKVNTMHTHVLPWADRPLVSTLLAGGDEGIDDAGISLARLIPNPWLFLEATGQVFRGTSAPVFQSNRAGELAYVGHLRAYRDLTESSNLDLGVSYARGHNDAGVEGVVPAGRFITSLSGIDVTLRWRPLRRAIYRSFVARSEVMWSGRQQPGPVQRAAGYYVSGDYQLARRWFAGTRIDRSGHPDDAALDDRSQSALLTFWPSEFSQIRGQYRRTQFGNGDRANELFLQLQFSIGAHGAHPF